MANGLEKVIERVLWESRFMIMLAVVSGIVAAFVMVLIGTYEVFLVVKGLFQTLQHLKGYEYYHREAITHLIGAIDVFLIATVLLIFGIGLYELFISKIDYIESETESSKILVIHNLDQLKAKLAKVIIMVLIVTFFKYAISFKYSDITSLLYLSLGILLIAISVYFMHKGDSEHGHSNE
jgi:uncharacterized membrane protein YqhA